LRIRDWTLRTKVVLHVVVLGLLSAGLLAVLFISTQTRVIRNFSRQSAEVAGLLIKNNVFLLKKCGRVQDTQAEIHTLEHLSEVIKGIRILTLEGRVFASTREEENLTVLPEEDVRVLREMLAGGPPRRLFISRRDRSIRSLILVENGPECADCHAQDRPVNGFLDVRLDYADVSSLLWRSQGQGIVLGVVVLGLLAFIILRLFERLVDRPIRRLEAGMKKVREGDLTVRWAPATKDEIGGLMESFNVMVGDLKKANDRIEALYNDRIERTEHLAAFGELAAGLAHEVKNPLSGIKGALEIINRGTPDGDPQKEIFREILVQVETIINVIQDFLSYARPKPLRFGLVPPGLFVGNAVRLARTQVGGKRIAFEVEGLPDDLRVSVDTDRMQEVVLNLLLNGIAAIPEEGAVAVRLRKGPGETLEVAVSDDGTGIRERDLDLIFEPFFSTKKGGTGLGLSISRKTVDAHGGTISVESREGRGTTFLIRLPLAPRDKDHAEQEDPDRR
jgi:hypothetical protein